MVIKLLRKLLQGNDEELLERIESLETDRDMLIEELGDIASYCDKCDGGSVTDRCFKCNGTGVVRKKQLMSWPW